MSEIQALRPPAVPGSPVEHDLWILAGGIADALRLLAEVHALLATLADGAAPSLRRELIDRLARVEQLLDEHGDVLLRLSESTAES